MKESARDLHGSPRGMRYATLPILCAAFLALDASEASALATYTALPGFVHWDRPVAAWTVAGDLGRAGLRAQAWICIPAGRGCMSQAELRSLLARQRRFDALREDPVPGQNGATVGVGPVPQARYLPPPTPESHILPAYRAHSVVRPEWSEHSVVKPEWSEHRLAPPEVKDGDGPAR